MRGLYYILFYTSLFFVLACSSLPFPSSQWKKEDIKNQNIIIFIPGLFGSALAEVSTGERYFQTLGQGLWGGPLALNGELLGIKDSKVLRPDGILESVTILPGIYAADGYGDSVRYLQTTFLNSHIIPFYYDWRDDDLRGVQALGKEVRALKEAGAKRIALVGHSLGGSLISFYLRYGEQELKGANETWEGTKYVDVAVIAGTPYRGTIAAYRDLLHGTKVGLSTSQLSALSLGSFPSYYQFLPPIENYPDLYKPDNWPVWKMGLFSNTENCSIETLQKRKDYTEKYLKNGLHFNTMMRGNFKNQAPIKTPFLAITGTGKNTLSSVKNNTQWSTSEDGDGLVTVESSMPPAAFKKALNLTHISLPLEHRGMFTNTSVQEKVTAFLKTHGF